MGASPPDEKMLTTLMILLGYFLLVGLLLQSGRPGGLSSGNPRMLLEFESCRGDILNVFATKKKEGSTAESA